MSEAWYLIYTKPKKELFVKHNLSIRNINTFCPTIEEYRWKCGRLEPNIKPFFPGYIFAYLSLLSDYYKVKWMSGVKKFITFGDLPLPVDGQLIDLLRSYTNKDDLIERKSLKKGDKVKVKSGPCKGLIGIIENDVPPLGRVKVLMDIIEYQGTVELPEQLCELNS